MSKDPEFSVLIPTYRRGSLLQYTLRALQKQTYRNFEVVVILKPSGDETEKIIEENTRRLKIRLILQRKGYVVDALNLGLEHAGGDIIAFLDDDAVPSRDWVEKQLESYRKFGNVGGVAGDVVPAKIKDGKLLIYEGESHIIPEFRYPTFFEGFFHKVLDAPIEGMENYLVYISKAGIVSYNHYLSNYARRGVVESLLGMGANMSVLYEAVEDFRFPRSWILGLAWEQFLGWYLWRKGYNLIFNPDVKVYHLIHGETLTRNIKNAKRDVLREIENYLLFHRLWGLEPGVSWMHRIAWLIFSYLIDLKKICLDREVQRLNKLRGKLWSEVIGLKWRISKIIDGKYNPLTDLENPNFFE